MQKVVPQKKRKEQKLPGAFLHSLSVKNWQETGKGPAGVSSPADIMATTGNHEDNMTSCLFFGSLPPGMSAPGFLRGVRKRGPCCTTCAGEPRIPRKDSMTA